MKNAHVRILASRHKSLHKRRKVETVPGLRGCDFFRLCAKMALSCGSFGGSPPNFPTCNSEDLRIHKGRPRQWQSPSPPDRHGLISPLFAHANSDGETREYPSIPQEKAAGEFRRLAVTRTMSTGSSPSANESGIAKNVQRQRHGQKCSMCWWPFLAARWRRTFVHGAVCRSTPTRRCIFQDADIVKSAEWGGCPDTCPSLNVP